LDNSSLRSMTGFGRAQVDSELGQFEVELRSVNSRFQEFRINLPPMLSSLEMRLRSKLKENIYRGKIDCRVKYSPPLDLKPRVQFNEPLILEYLEKLRSIHDRAELRGEVTLDQVLRLPGATDPIQDEIDDEGFWNVLSEVLDLALANYQEERAREGKALAEHIQAELNLLRENNTKIKAQKENILQAFREKLGARIAELEEKTRAILDSNRLEFEVAAFADRCDVSEELVRLEAHLDRLQTIIGSKGTRPAGKALDFLLQDGTKNTKNYFHGS